MMAAAYDWREFASREDLARTLAGKVVEVLREAIGNRGTAFLAVSGGTTPGLFFRTLSGQELDWSKVVVTLIDERFVPRNSPRSNAGLVAANLLQGTAARAKFVDLSSDAPSVEDAASRANEELSRLPFPLDAAILGMGTDGHTASFFPDAGNLGALLDPSSDAIVLPVQAASGGEPRLTLTLARIVEAGFVALHIEGVEKRRVLEGALAAGTPLPVRVVLDHARRPAQVFWAP